MKNLLLACLTLLLALTASAGEVPTPAPNQPPMLCNERAVVKVTVPVSATKTPPVFRQNDKAYTAERTGDLWAIRYPLPLPAVGVYNGQVQVGAYQYRFKLEVRSNCEWGGECPCAFAFPNGVTPARKHEPH